MRSFLFIGDPENKIAEWLEGEHKVLVIAPSEDHDSTARALTTLKTAGLEHDIVKTINLNQEYIFGDGKIDEYLKDSTNQTHYPYIYINKEFVGDHRTVAYMDYQGTLINTVGLVFLVSQSSSTRHTSGEVENRGCQEEEEEEEEGTATDRYFERKKQSAETKRAVHSGGLFSSPPGVGSGSRGSSGNKRPVSLKEELKKCELRASASDPASYLSSPESPTCWSFANRGSPKPNKDNCSSCDLKKRTAEVQTQTFKENLSVDSKNSKNPVAHDHAS